MGARLTKIKNFTAFTGLENIQLSWNSLTSFPTNEITSPDFISLVLDSNDFASIDVSNLVNLQYLSLGYNQFTNIDISNNVNLISAPFASNRLTETSVNNILIQLDNNGLLNGFCYTAEGTNEAPTGAGKSFIIGYISKLMQDNNNSCWNLAHRIEIVEELIKQCINLSIIIIINIIITITKL